MYTLAASRHLALRPTLLSRPDPLHNSSPLHRASEFIHLTLPSIHLTCPLLVAGGVVFNLLAMLGGDLSRVFNGGLLQGYTQVRKATQARTVHARRPGSPPTRHEPVRAHHGGWADSPCCVWSYSQVVWLLVLNNAFNGLAISAILKYTDNIVRVFAHAAAMMLTMALEIFLFGAPPTPQLLISATVVACAVYLYNRATPPAGAQPLSPVRAAESGEGGASGGAAERRPLLSTWLDMGTEEPVEQLPPLFPMLTRGADGYSIRTRKITE